MKRSGRNSYRRLRGGLTPVESHCLQAKLVSVLNTRGEFGYDELDRVEELLIEGAKANEPGYDIVRKKFVLPLTEAVNVNSDKTPALMELLFRHGAQATKKGPDGKSPLDVATYFAENEDYDYGLSSLRDAAKKVAKERKERKDAEDQGFYSKELETFRKTNSRIPDDVIDYGIKPYLIK